MIKLFLFGLLAFAAGVGIPIMGSLNAGLGARIASPSLAAVILLFVAFTTAALYMLANGSPSLPKNSPPLHLFLGGFFVAFYVLTITTIAPKIGIANVIFLALLGQIITTSVIDHFGLLGVIKSHITMQRCIGILLMAVGVYLARRVT